MTKLHFKKCESWTQIKNICEKGDFKILAFDYGQMKFFLRNFHGRITLEIDNITENYSIDKIVHNLPQNLDNLIINICPFIKRTMFENIFTNLPFNLKEFKIIFKNSSISHIALDEKNGCLNMLFNIKLPFDCNFFVIYENTTFYVKYIDKNNELELRTFKKTIRIKYTIKQKQRLMDLVAFGAQDIYLTSSPAIKYYKMPYKTYANFSM